MKDIFIAFFITLLLCGCSSQPLTLETQIPSTTALIVTSTLSKDPTQGANKAKETETLIATTPTNEVLPTTTTKISNFSIAGIETKKSSDTDLIANAGMSWTRQNALWWHLVEQKKGERAWSVLDDLEKELIEASDLGLTTILIVHGTPEWAQKVPGSYCGPVKENELIFLGEFLFDAVRRYSEPPYNVKYWELGNEPDINAFSSGPFQQFGCWGDINDNYYGGGYYAEMLKVVYPRIKAADPSAQVLIGGLLLDCDPITPPEIPTDSGQYKDCRPATFLEGVLINGGGEYFDGVAFHAYDYYDNAEGQYSNINWNSSWDSTGPVLVVKTRYLNELLARFGYDDKYLMNTEGALICGRDGKEPSCQTDVFNQTKASYLVQTYTVARAVDLRANIWFFIQGWRGSGLIDKDGKPLLAFNALVFNSSILKDARFHAEILDFVGIIGYSFLNQESEIWVLWSHDSNRHNIFLDEQPDHLYDVVGRAITPIREISIGHTPVYIIWDKNP